MKRQWGRETTARVAAEARSSELDAALMDLDNRAQRLLLALALDTSQSMTGVAIARLNEALAAMVQDLRRDVQLSAIAEVALITFGDGGVTVWRGDRPAAAGESPFVPARQLTVPKLRASGVTPMVPAVERAIQCVADEKAELKRRFLQYYRPLIWLMSDGVPTDANGHHSDDWRRLPPIIKDGEDSKGFVFFSVSVGDIDPVGDAVLRELAPGAHVRLEGFDFASMLKLVSASAESAAKGDSVEAIKRRVTAAQVPLTRV
jgi:uncharacterized protein YegL